MAYSECDEERRFRIGSYMERYTYHCADERAAAFRLARPRIDDQPAEPMPVDQPADPCK